MFEMEEEQNVIVHGLALVSAAHLVLSFSLLLLNLS